MAAASIIGSVVTGGSNSHQTVAEELNAYATDFVNQGVVGAITLGAGSTAGTGAFAVTQDSSPDMGVTVLLGNAYVSGTPSTQDAQVLRARMTSNYTGYTINANASGSTKYDWIYLQLSASNANNPSLAGDNVITLVTSRSTSNASDNGSPPTYGILLAVVTVVNGASSITNANISDRRTQASLSSINSGGSTGWNSLGYALTYGANNGNKEFTVTTPNNLTGLLTAGMRLSIARSSTPPTQAMKFVAASSQYATLASPSGITFTGAFTCEAWIYLTSYVSGASADSHIIDRTNNTTGGFALCVKSDGRLRLYYGGSSSFTDFISNQAIPLNTWTHVAGVCTSVSGKTGALYINGVLAPSTQGTTAATTLVQTSNLSIGAAGAGVANTFFDGYISEARIWSTNQTLANIQANMAINCVGTETNLVALFQGNGAFTDATSNANNLTAQAGAIATQASNPYNATEYAIITNVSYSNPTTTITLFTGNSNTIPNQTLNSPYYSTARAPYGFPAGRSNWRVQWYAGVSAGGSASTNTWVNQNNAQLSVPTGLWMLGYQGMVSVGTSSSVTDVYTTLSTANNSETDITFTTRFTMNLASGTTTQLWSTNRSRPLSLASQTIYYANLKSTTANTALQIRGETTTGEKFIIEAECAYL